MGTFAQPKVWRRLRLNRSSRYSTGLSILALRHLAARTMAPIITDGTTVQPMIRGSTPYLYANSEYEMKRNVVKLVM